MIICGYEKMSMVDYDSKIACTVFTGGCNFRCPFCHNASLVLGSDRQTVDEGEVLEYLTKRRGLVDALVVSGGEPTLQHDLEDFIRKVKGLGYLVKLDTNGTNPDVVEHLISEGLLDYIAMDVKNSEKKYPLTVDRQVDIGVIERSIEIIKNSGVAYEFRTTLIREFHTEDDISKIADMISGAERYYMQKYNDDDGCISHGYSAFDKSEVERFKALFDGKVKMVGIRGY